MSNEFYNSIMKKTAENEKRLADHIPLVSFARDRVDAAAGKGERETVVYFGLEEHLEYPITVLLKAMQVFTDEGFYVEGRSDSPRAFRIAWWPNKGVVQAKNDKED